MIKKQNIRKIKKIPTLRFSEFSEEWEEKRLGDIATIITGQTPPTSNRSFYGGEFLFVSPVDFNGQRYIKKTKTTCTKAGFDKVRNVEKDSVLFVCIGSTIGKIAQAYKDCITNQQINSIIADKNNLNNFVFFSLFNEVGKIKLLAGKQAVPIINKNEFSKIKINLPKKQEQQKIANFLGLVDEWLENLRVQKESLEEYKKGMMQKIFPARGEKVPEIRFQDDEGEGFEKWEEKRLNELGKTFNGLSGKKGDDFGEGDPFVTYKQIFDTSEIDINKFAFVKIGSKEKQNKVQFGDLFFTTSSETPLEVGFSSVMLNKDISPYLNSFSFGFRPNSLKELSPNFSKFFFRSATFRREIIKLAQGSTRYNISKIGFMKIRILLPSYLEQQKIAEFLTSIDNLIGSKQKQISQAQEWKKGLMQGLFV